MTKPKSNRMNRCASSRATLRELERKGVLWRDRIGVRHIIRASTGAIERIGLNVDELHGPYRGDPTLSNFRTVWQCEAWVGYNGGRARLIGTQVYPCIPPERLADFPVNHAATELIRQASTKGCTFYPTCEIVGDAVLVTDHREHCVLQPKRRDFTADDLAFFGSMLATPHSHIFRWGHYCILFHEEPRELDIIAMKLRWS
jgi:hypothetical protein